MSFLKSQHTLGPWRAVETQPETPAKPCVWAVFGADTSHEATLCELWSGEHDNPANARLIASAPEMLELIRRIERDFSSRVRSVNFNNGESVLESLRQTISKAITLR